VFGDDFSKNDSNDLDRYADYESAFQPRQPRKRKPDHKPKRDQRAQLESVAEVGALESGFNTTYRPGLFEEGWLLDSLRPFHEMGLLADVLSRVKGGKEANVYRCRGTAITGEALLAVKVYRPQMFRTMKNDHVYREGRDILSGSGAALKKTDHREMRAIGKKSDYGMAVMHTSWLMHEFKTLKALHEAGASVPKPLAAAPNGILMGFVGDAHLSAPALGEVRLDEDEAAHALAEVIRNLRVMLSLNMVHGDLSAYNLLYWDERVVLIDFPQVVSVTGNPNARDLFARDVARIAAYFNGCGLDIDPASLTDSLWGEHGE
jgi:RIO kinase 1